MAKQNKKIPLPQPQNQTIPAGQKPMSETEANKPENTSQPKVSPSTSSKESPVQIVPVPPTLAELLVGVTHVRAALRLLYLPENSGKYTRDEACCAIAAAVGMSPSSIPGEIGKSNVRALAAGKQRMLLRKCTITRKPGRTSGQNFVNEFDGE